MKETFAIPAVGAIIEKEEDGVLYLLMQTRQKENDHNTNGLLEFPAGKVREYESLFVALRREVKEETGLNLTAIAGSERTFSTDVNGQLTLCAEPFCLNQNLNGAYSILLSVFLCRAEGELLEGSDESCQIQWMRADDVLSLLLSQPERFFLMSINPLKKYFGI